jgi:hypothetical protein
MAYRFGLAEKNAFCHHLAAFHAGRQRINSRILCLTSCVGGDQSVDLTAKLNVQDHPYLPRIVLLEGAFGHNASRFKKASTITRASLCAPTCCIREHMRV